MVKHFILSVFIIFLSFSFIQKGWIKTQVDPNVSVQFPKKPDKQKKGEESVFITDTDHGIFMTSVLGVSDKYKIPDDQQGILKFLDGFNAEALKKVTGKELSKKEVIIGGVTGKEIKYKGIFPGTESESIVYRQVFTVKKVIYSFDYWILGDAETTVTDSEKGRFFGSITIIKK